MRAIVTGKKGDTGAGVTGSTAEVQVLYWSRVSGIVYQAAIADHLIRMQQPMCPVAVGDTLHTGKMVRGKNGLVDDEFAKVRHMDADVID